MCLLPHHVNGFIDDNVLDPVHLDEGGGLTAGGIAGGQLNSQGADDQQGLVVHLHKVDVKGHTHQGDEDGTGQDSRVLHKREHAHMEKPMCELFTLIAIKYRGLKKKKNTYNINQI